MFELKDDIKYNFYEYIKKYKIENVYFGELIYINNIKKLDGNICKYGYLSLGKSLFYVKENNSCINLRTHFSHTTKKEEGFCVNIDYDRKNIKEYFIKNNILYNEYMTKEEIFRAIYKRYQNSDKSSALSKLIRKRNR